MSFRFAETHANLLRTVPGDVRPINGHRGSVYAYLKMSNVELTEVDQWLDRHHGLVACRDLLAVSLAVDFDREDGDPSKPRTAVGALRRLAKTYGGASTMEVRRATDDLAGMLVEAIERVDAYCTADLVVAMPPHEPSPDHDLVSELVKRIAAMSRREDGKEVVTTTRTRPSAKDLTRDQKFTALNGTFAIDVRRIRGRAILLVDDLYQSGISMNFVAMKLQQAGASHILGLVAEKTCRNDANARAQ